MPDNATEHERVPAAPPEVLDTDSGRRPIVGIAAGVVLVALIALVLLRAASNNTPHNSYSSQVTSTTITRISDTTASIGGTTARGHRSAATPTLFFFVMVSAMALVGVRIFWGARRLSRVAHPPSSTVDHTSSNRSVVDVSSDSLEDVDAEEAEEKHRSE